MVRLGLVAVLAWVAEVAANAGEVLMAVVVAVAAVVAAADAPPPDIVLYLAPPSTIECLETIKFNRQ